jgi:SAM-dependent methyltransferase
MTPKGNVKNINLVWGTQALLARRESIRHHYDKNAKNRNIYIKRNSYFYGLLEELFNHLTSPSRRVLQVGCHNGNFLPAVKAKDGTCVDVSTEMLRVVSEENPEFKYHCSLDETLPDMEPFDDIIITNSSEAVDIYDSLIDLKKCIRPDTRVYIYNYNRLWEYPFILAEALRLKFPQVERNWITINDINGFLISAGYEPLKVYRKVLIPFQVPALSWIFNKIIAPLPIFNKFCLVNIIVARIKPAIKDPKTVSVSVVVPCKNEFDNIATAINRIPEMGSHTEIIFCDDKSTDGTSNEVLRLQKENPKRDIKLLTGPGICKAENVWTGFNGATGDVLMILDADLTVMPEKLPQFLDVLAKGYGEFINGSRMVYPMQSDAMRGLNIFGNKGFSLIFQIILGHAIKDTLCGTKVFWRKDWPRIQPMVGTWGIKDRWGDFDLLFGAAKLQMKIIDLPVHYQDRIHGVTKMTGRLKNAAIMYRICWTAFWKLKWL